MSGEGPRTPKDVATVALGETYMFMRVDHPQGCFRSIHRPGRRHASAADPLAFTTLAAPVFLGFIFLLDPINAAPWRRILVTRSR